MIHLLKYHLRAAMTMLVATLAIVAGAHEMDNIEIHVVINDHGHARVAEVRQCVMQDYGTEGFIKMYNLHGMQVGELAVSDETGTQYAVDDPWDINRNRQEKTNHCGINMTDDGPELCWGIGEAGPRTYNIHYTLTGLVNSLDDYDGFNFKFYEPAGLYPKHARIVIEPENGTFTTDNTRVWAFRYYGTVNIVNGKIVAETNQAFAKDGEGMVIMAQFDKGVFHPVTTRKGTFLKKYKKPAFKGSDYTLSDDETNGKASLKGDGYNNEESTFWEDLWNVISGMLQLVLWVAIPIVFLLKLIGIKDEVKLVHQNQKLFGNKQGEMTEWSRDLPFEGDLYRTSGVLKAVDAGDLDPKDQIAAVVMRMTHLGLIVLQKRADAFANDDNDAEFLITPPLNQKIHNDKQEELIKLIHQQMWNAAGIDHILQPQEMKEYMKQYPVEHRSVVKRITKLLDGGNRYRGELTRDEVRQVYGLKKFLQEFTLLEERHVLEVGLWKEYMVFATLYGIAKQVFKDLKKIWPDFTTLAPQEELLLDTDIATTVATYTISGMNYVKSYETPDEREARLRREASERRSSGGGGSSSYGGGGGHSGGGGSGFR